MTTVENLVQVGGKLWNGQRVYFNQLQELYGLQVSFYKTGNISSASVDGDPISNGKASRIMSECKFGKLYYDIATETFMIGNGLSGEVATKIVGQIKSRIAEEATCQITA